MHVVSTMLVSAALAHVASADAHLGKSKILIVGDSMGEFSCNFIQELCAGSTVENKAIRARQIVRVAVLAMLRRAVTGPNLV